MAGLVSRKIRIHMLQTAALDVVSLARRGFYVRALDRSLRYVTVPRPLELARHTSAHCCRPHAYPIERCRRPT